MCELMVSQLGFILVLTDYEEDHAQAMVGRR